MGGVLLKIYAGDFLVLAKGFKSQIEAQRWLDGSGGSTARYPKSAGYVHKFIYTAGPSK